MKIINNNLIAQEIQKIIPAKTTGAAGFDVQPSSTVTSFNDVLKNTIEGGSKLSFSKHANMRLSSREINLSDAQIRRVEDGVQKAVMKGINDSLVIVDDVALVVNVRSKVVVTALNKGQFEKNVFTNIDGAVIV